MAPVQKTFSVIPDLPSCFTAPNADGVPAGKPSRPPMTTKQAKKAYKNANKGPKLSKAEQRRQDLMEQDRIRRELEKEKNQSRARARADKKKEKEDKLKADKKKKGLPLVEVRPSQGTLARFVKAPKKADQIRERIPLPLLAVKEEEDSDSTAGYTSERPAKRQRMGSSSRHSFETSPVPEQGMFRRTNRPPIITHAKPPSSQPDQTIPKPSFDVDDPSTKDMVDQQIFNESFGAGDDLFDGLDSTEMLEVTTQIPSRRPTLELYGSEICRALHDADENGAEKTDLAASEIVLSAQSSLPKTTTAVADVDRRTHRPRPELQAVRQMHQVVKSCSDTGSQNDAGDKSCPLHHDVIFESPPAKVAQPQLHALDQKFELGVPSEPLPTGFKEAQASGSAAKSQTRQPLRDVSLNKTRITTPKDAVVVPVKESLAQHGWANRTPQPLFRKPQQAVSSSRILGQPKTPMAPPPLPPLLPRGRPTNRSTFGGAPNSPNVIRDIRHAVQSPESLDSGFAAPPSTQLLLATEFDDIFPSPSQEVRELFEDTNTGSPLRPSARNSSLSNASRLPPPPQRNIVLPNPLKLPEHAQVRSTNHHSRLMSQQGSLQTSIHPVRAAISRNLIEAYIPSTQDLFLSSQDLMELEEQSLSASAAEAPAFRTELVETLPKLVEPGPVSTTTKLSDRQRIVGAQPKRPGQLRTEKPGPTNSQVVVHPSFSPKSNSQRTLELQSSSEMPETPSKAFSPRRTKPAVQIPPLRKLDSFETIPKNVGATRERHSQDDATKVVSLGNMKMQHHVSSQVAHPTHMAQDSMQMEPPRPSPKPFLNSSGTREKYAVERSKTAAWEGAEAQRKAQAELQRLEDKRFEKLVSEDLGLPENWEEIHQPRTGGTPVNAGRSQEEPSQLETKSGRLPQEMSRLQNIVTEEPDLLSATTTGGEEKLAIDNSKSSNPSRRLPARKLSNEPDRKQASKAGSQKKPQGSYEAMVEILKTVASGEKSIPASQETDYDDGDLGDEDLCGIMDKASTKP